MISDVLARLAILHKEIPEEEFDVDDAVEVAVDDLDRDLSDEEWSELNDLLPEWLEDDEEELVADGGTTEEESAGDGHCYWCGDETADNGSIRVQMEEDEPKRETCPDCFRDWPPEEVTA